MSKGTDMTSKQHEQPQSWTIIQISDTHLMNQDDLEFVHMNPEQSFHRVMAQIQQEYPEAHALIHTGDLAQVPVPETYQRYLSFMQSTGFPHYQVPGNHDSAEFFPFHDQQNKVHAIPMGNWCLMLLNSAVKGKIDGWIESEQLKQLDQLLKQHAEQHILIACHHHPFEMRSRWIDQHILKNTEHLTDVLAKHQNVKLVLCGHVHQTSENQWHGIHFLSTPSTCVQFKPHSDDFALDDEAPGYRVVHLKANGEFSTQIHRTQPIQKKINIEITGY